VLRATLPPLMDQVPAAVRTLWLPYCVRADCFNGNLAREGAADVDATSALPTKAGGLAWDVEVVAKFCNYACVAVAVSQALVAFELLGL
jgi:hypothetical protein